MKKITILTLLLLAMTLFIFCDSTAEAKIKKGTDANGNTWKYNTKTNTLTFKGNSSLEEYDDCSSGVPSWFKFSEKAKKVVIKGKISKISYGTFRNFENLENVIMADSVKNIDSCAFSSCKKLKQIKFSKNLKKIGSYAFDNGNLKRIELPNSLQIIGRGAFENQLKLKRITIPANVKKIGDNVFWNCPNLTRMIIKSKKLKYIGEDILVGAEKKVIVKVPKECKKNYKDMISKGIENSVIRFKVIK